MWQLLKKFIGQRKTPQRSAEKKYHILYDKIHGGYLDKDANYLSAKNFMIPKLSFSLTSYFFSSLLSSSKKTYKKIFQVFDLLMLFTFLNMKWVLKMIQSDWGFLFVLIFDYSLWNVFHAQYAIRS